MASASGNSASSSVPGLVVSNSRAMNESAVTDKTVPSNFCNTSKPSRLKGRTGTHTTARLRTVSGPSQCNDVQVVECRFESDASTGAIVGVGSRFVSVTSTGEIARVGEKNPRTSNTAPVDCEAFCSLGSLVGCLTRLRPEDKSAVSNWSDSSTVSSLSFMFSSLKPA